jgi:alkylation response protein AidB-like acyl-CoA dehydrogenase
MTALTVDQSTALRESVRSLLGDRAGEAQVRQTMETAAGYDPALWTALAEIGIVGLIVAEEHGGSGAGPIELEMVMEEAGAALLCAPLLASSVLAASLLAAVNDSGAGARYLPRIADGTTIASAALTGPTGTWTPEGVAVLSTAPTAAGGAWTLNGTASFVLHAQNADLLLVAAHGADGISLFAVDVPQESVLITALPTFDRTLRLAQVEFAGASAVPIGAPGAGWAAAEQALDVARVALAGEQAGAAKQSLSITVDYAKVRVQFGRPIGSFQAIKHMAADLLLESESAISAARAAARALAEGAPDAGAAISLAAFACADAFTTVAATSIQMHGGIAFTWEHPAHLYLRRARADAQLLGTPAFYRERYLQQLGA